MYSSASLTRETKRVSGINASLGGGVAKFFAPEKIKFFGRSHWNFGARIQRDAQRGGIVLPVSKTQGANKWNQTK
jgi:hypothetical protein